VSTTTSTKVGPTTTKMAGAAATEVSAASTTAAEVRGRCVHRRGGEMGRSRMDGRR
jgi:hypothetical protein